MVRKMLFKRTILSLFIASILFATRPSETLEAAITPRQAVNRGTAVLCVGALSAIGFYAAGQVGAAAFVATTSATFGSIFVFAGLHHLSLQKSRRKMESSKLPPEIRKAVAQGKAPPSRPSRDTDTIDDVLTDPLYWWHPLNIYHSSFDPSVSEPVRKDYERAGQSQNWDYEKHRSQIEKTLHENGLLKEGEHLQIDSSQDANHPHFQIVDPEGHSRGSLTEQQIDGSFDHSQNHDHHRDDSQVESHQHSDSDHHHSPSDHSSASVDYSSDTSSDSSPSDSGGGDSGGGD